VDGAAHRGALEAGGDTVAVCGSGLDRTYPPAHADLAAEIMDRGALVSEFFPGTPPRRENFPRRNRLISGLSLGVLVVEAGLRSGSLITARMAGEQGREVFAIPGSIHNPLARGCHQLLRQGARLVESGADVLSELGALAAAGLAAPGPAGTAPEPPPAAPAEEPDPAYQALLEACGYEPVTAEILVQRTGLTAAEVSSMLLILELQGRLESGPGGRYTRI
jgi:DNA processing protein